MEGYGLVRLERGARGRITPKVVHDRVELDLPLTPSKRAARKREAV
jgi:predicted transcriptional regulator